MISGLANTYVDHPPVFLHSAGASQQSKIRYVDFPFHDPSFGSSRMIPEEARQDM